MIMILFFYIILVLFIWLRKHFEYDSSFHHIVNIANLWLDLDLIDVNHLYQRMVSLIRILNELLLNYFHIAKLHDWLQMYLDLLIL